MSKVLDKAVDGPRFVILNVVPGRPVDNGGYQAGPIIKGMNLNDKRPGSLDPQRYGGFNKLSDESHLKQKAIEMLEERKRRGRSSSLSKKQETPENIDDIVNTFSLVRPNLTEQTLKILN